MISQNVLTLLLFCVKRGHKGAFTSLFLLSTLFAQDTTSYQLDAQAIVDSVLMRYKSSSESTVFRRDASETFAVSGLSADAVLRQAEGLYIRNYGGHGGMKTISIRGFSTQQTTVTINDIPYTSAQTGLINFAYFYPDGYESIELTRNPASASFNPLGGNVGFNLKPTRNNSRVKVGLGSFEESLVDMSSEYKWKKQALRVGLMQIEAKDNYAYDLNGESGIRQNAGFRNQQYQLYYEYKLRENIQLSTLTLGYTAKQGIPGAIVVGNSGSANDSLAQNDFFSALQIRWVPKEYLHLWQPAKVTASLSVHKNKLRAWTDLREDVYDAQDILAQISAVHLFGNQSLVSTLQYNPQSLAGNNLARGFTPIESVTRTQANLGFLHRWHGWKDSTGVARVHTQVTARINVVNPYGLLGNGGFSLSYKPNPQSHDPEIFLHYHFGKRIPAFNELYYFGYGNTELKPEKVHNIDAGMLWLLHWGIDWQLKSVFFFNQTRNKIISIPISPARWSTYSIGAAQTTGMELAVELHPQKGQSLYCNYTLQQAVDISQKNSPLLPYTPMEVLNYGYKVEEKEWFAYLNGNISSWRFSLLDNSEQSFLPAYHVLDAGVGFTYTLPKFIYTLSVQGENLLNTNYVVIKSYPMPPMAVRITLQLGIR